MSLENFDEWLLMPATSTPSSPATRDLENAVPQDPQDTASVINNITELDPSTDPYSILFNELFGEDHDVTDQPPPENEPILPQETAPVPTATKQLEPVLDPLFDDLFGDYHFDFTEKPIPEDEEAVLNANFEDIFREVDYDPPLANDHQTPATVQRDDVSPDDQGCAPPQQEVHTSPQYQDLSATAKLDSVENNANVTSALSYNQYDRVELSNPKNEQVSSVSQPLQYADPTMPLPITQNTLPAHIPVRRHNQTQYQTFHPTPSQAQPQTHSQYSNRTVYPRQYPIPRQTHYQIQAQGSLHHVNGLQSYSYPSSNIAQVNPPNGWVPQVNPISEGAWLGPMLNRGAREIRSRQQQEQQALNARRLQVQLEEEDRQRKMDAERQLRQANESLLDSHVNDGQGKRAQQPFRSSEFGAQTTPELIGIEINPSERKSLVATKPEPKNYRTQNIANDVKTKSLYTPLTAPPASWVGRDDKGNARVKFEYTEHGELIPGTRFSRTQLAAYFKQHPLHPPHPTRDDTQDTKNSKLVLWIQSVPADSGNRYPTKYSSRCRFEDCVAGSIRNGHYRIAFDEQHWRNANTDPFHCAGYVHLYCLEKSFNFRTFCKEFNVQPDTRETPHERGGRNRMAITRDKVSMEQVCVDFMESPGGSGGDWFKYSLTRALTKEHNKEKSISLSKRRKEAKGIDIEVHLGNLDVEFELKKKRQSEKNSREQSSASSAGLTPQRKRKADKREDDSDLGDDGLNLDTAGVSPRLKRQRQGEHNSRAQTGATSAAPPSNRKRKVEETDDSDLGDDGLNLEAIDSALARPWKLQKR